MAKKRKRVANVVTKKYKNLHGFEELEAKLKDLASTQKKSSEIRYEVRGVLQKAGGHIVKAAVGLAPAKPSNIKDGLQSLFGQDKLESASTVVMALFKISPWWHWWEFGTSARYTKTGAHRGAIAPVKFLRRGVSSARAQVAAEIAGGLKEIVKGYEV